MSSERPSFHRIDHIAWTVTDLKAVSTFYKDVLGFRERYSMGPFDAADLPRAPSGADWTQSHIEVPGAKLSICMLQLGDGTLFELFEYEKPLDAVRTPPRSCDVGGHHLGLRVDDLEAAAEHLKAHGCTLAEEKIILDSGPTAGSRAWYVRDPWGNQLELMEYDHMPWMDQDAGGEA